MTESSDQELPFRVREFTLTSAECANAVAIAAETAQRHTDSDDPEFLDQPSVYARDLPPRLIQFLRDVRHDDTTVAAVLRGGWHPELDKLRTPHDWRHAYATRAGNIHNFLVALYGSVLGEVFSWYGQQAGRIVHDLVPTFEDRNEQLGSGSEAPLQWHTEDAFHPCRADFVALYSVRAKHDAKSTLSWLPRGALGPDTTAILMEERYEFTPDSSYSDHDTFRNEPAALLYGSTTAPYLRADSVYYKTPSDARERQALTELFAALNEAQIELEMSSGDMLILNNQRVVHGRTAYQAQFNGSDRWVKRVNITNDLQRSDSHRCCAASRIVHLSPQRDLPRATHSCDRHSPRAEATGR